MQSEDCHQEPGRCYCQDYLEPCGSDVDCYSFGDDDCYEHSSDGCAFEGGDEWCDDDGPNASAIALGIFVLLSMLCAMGGLMCGCACCDQPALYFSGFEVGTSTNSAAYTVLDVMPMETVAEAEEVAIVLEATKDALGSQGASQEPAELPLFDTVTGAPLNDAARRLRQQ